MPARLLREGILTSEAVDALSLEAELLYRRVMSVVDDFGLFHGNPKLIRAACFPLRLDQVSDADVAGWIDECVAAALVARATFAGKAVIVVLRFGQQQRAKASKYLPGLDLPAIERFLATAHRFPAGEPVPPPRAGDPQALADDPLADANGVRATAHLGEGECGDGDGDEGEGVTRAPARRLPAAPRTWAEWASWWKQERGVETTVRDRKAFVPLAERWIAQGVTLEQMHAALVHAETTSPKPIAYLPAYVDRVLAALQTPESPAAAKRTAFVASITGRPAAHRPDPRTVDVDAIERPAAPALPAGRG